MVAFWEGWDLIVSIDEKFRSGIAAGFWFRVSHEVVIKTSAGLHSSEGLTGAGGSTSKIVPLHDRGFSFLLAVCKKLQFLISGPPL